MFEESLKTIWLGSALLLAAFAFFGWKNREAIKKTFQLGKKDAAILVLLFFASLAVQSFFHPYHKMYVDEPWYLESAKNIASRGEGLLCEYTAFESMECRPYEKMHGWPAVLAVFFAAFGATDETSFFASSVLSALSGVVLFLVARILFEGRAPAIAASAFFALDPTRLYWAASAETNAPTLFFALLAVLAAAIAYKSKPAKRGNEWVAAFFASAAALAATMRADYALLAICLFPMVKKSVTERSIQHVALAGLLGFAVVAPQLFAFSEAHFESYPGNFGVQNVAKNAGVIFQKAQATPAYLLLVFLAAVGMHFLRGKKEVFLSLAAIAAGYAAFVLFWTEFSIFQDRMLLPLVAVFSLAAGLAAAKIAGKIPAAPMRALLGLALFAALVAPLPSLVEWANHPQLENELVKKLQAFEGRDCYVLAEWPTIVHASTNLKAMSVRRALEKPQAVREIGEKTGCVLYLKDQYCENSDFISNSSKAACEKMGIFEMTGLASVSNGVFSYSLLELRSKV